MKPKLLYVITRLVAGGAQHLLLDLVEHLRGEYDIHIAAGPETGHEGSLWNEARMLLPEGHVHVCRQLVRNVRPHRDLRAYFELLRLIRALKPDIVHTHTSKAGFLGRLAAHRAGVPRIVHSTHGLIFHKEANIPGVSGHLLVLFFFKIMERMAGQRCHAIVCLSEREVGDVLRLDLGPSHTVTCIPNGADLAPFATIPRAREDWRQREVRIGAAGRLNREKGYDLLLRAFRHLLDRFPNLCLEIAGSGPLLGKLQKMVAALGLEGKVVFRGYIKDMRSFLAGLDIFMLSSHYEGFGLVLIEAMAAGLPVVATDVGGVAEVLDGGKAGTVVPPGCEPDLAIAVEYLLVHPGFAFELGQKGRSHALANYSMDHMIQAHRRIYRGDKRPPLAEPVSGPRHAVDLHLHTLNGAASRADVDAILVAAFRCGLKAVVLTGHGKVAGALEARRRAPVGLMVIPGVEVRSDAGDLIGLFVERPITATHFKDVIAEIRAQDGLVYLPHPFRDRSSVTTEVAAGVDIVEVCNGRFNKSDGQGIEFGDMALVNFARAYRKTGVGASDGLELADIGRVQTILPPFANEAELRALLKSGRIFPVRKDGEWVAATLVEV